MNKFAEWMKNNEKVQRGVAEKLGISNTTLHEILKKNQTPSLKVAYAIEVYTQGAITIYDWVDQEKEKKSKTNKTKLETAARKTKK